MTGYNFSPPNVHQANTSFCWLIIRPIWCVMMCDQSVMQVVKINSILLNLPHLSTPQIDRALFLRPYLPFQGDFVRKTSDHAQEVPFQLKFTFTPNGKREFVPRDQVFFVLVVYCLLLLLKNKYFHASFIHKNCSGQFLFSYFLFWEILNLNPTLAVCRKRES